MRASSRSDACPLAYSRAPTVAKIVLMGGGHAHLMAVPALAEAVRGRAEISLVAPAEHLLYSGMMPGWISGQYDFEDCAIHLKAVCERHGVHWVEDEIVDIDFGAQIAVGARGRYAFDLASVNVGSANELGTIGPDAPIVLGAKPFAEFVTDWRARAIAPPGLAAMSQATVVGGGAAAVEIAFALRCAAPGTPITLATAGDALLQGMSPIAGRLAQHSLRAHGVELRFGHRYIGAERGSACFDARAPLRADLVVVATGARPPRWLTRAASVHGVSVTRDGGVAIRSDLRSVSHAQVFAAGDCATFVEGFVPKSGVHALRQGPVLAGNLARSLDAGTERGAGAARAAAGEGRLTRFAPRRWTLALLNRCDGSAIGAWGPLGFSGRWVWRWKDRIDRRFMARFRPDDSAPPVGLR